MHVIKTTLLISLVLLLSSCSKEKWEGFVYPNENDLSNHKNIGVYESLKSCRDAALNTLARINSIEKGDYECGLNCEYRSGMREIKVCEKTEH